jgi:excisionase family DNA binding protein
MFPARRGTRADSYTWHQQNPSSGAVLPDPPVGARGFEPPTPRPPVFGARRALRLVLPRKTRSRRRRARSIAINDGDASAPRGTISRQPGMGPWRRLKGVAALLTVPEVAAELRVSVRTVLGFIASGDLRALHGVGRGRGYRVRREWVDAFLRSREKNVPSPSGPAHELPRGPAKAARHPTESFTSTRDARIAVGLVRGGQS